MINKGESYWSNKTEKMANTRLDSIAERVVTECLIRKMLLITTEEQEVLTAVDLVSLLEGEDLWCFLDNANDHQRRLLVTLKVVGDFLTNS